MMIQQRYLTWFMIALCVILFGYILRAKSTEQCDLKVGERMIKNGSQVKNYVLIYVSIVEPRPMFLINYQDGDGAVLRCLGRGHWINRSVTADMWRAFKDVWPEEYQ